jgi:filamentous hemagglutinin
VPTTLNRYAYVLNNPVNHVDPSGLCVGPAVLACGAAAGAAIETVAGGLAVGALAAAANDLSAAASDAGLAVRAGIENLGERIKPGLSGGANAGGRFSQGTKEDALNEDPECVYCGINPSEEVDHSIPKSRGGTSDPENAQGTCQHCNRSKGARDYPQNPPSNWSGDWPPSWSSPWP